MWDTTVGWRFNNPKLDAMYPIISLGETAENIAVEMKISRQEQDEFSVESHRRAVNALNNGLFEKEIVPISVKGRRNDPIIIDTDEHPRYRKEGDQYVLDTSVEDMRKLRPAFSKNGTVTAGNSSGINDGAAALLMMSADRALSLGVKPKMRWLGSAVAGVDPSLMGYGPVPATEKLLKRHNLTLDDIELVELNEAFAAQTLGCMRRLGLSNDRTNVNGGAIALGHPTGSSGSRILVTMMHEMERRTTSTLKRPMYGIATLCVGVGMGVSTLVEWIGD
jgi:acetyl-CoA acetyltransferase family protein